MKKNLLSPYEIDASQLIGTTEHVFHPTNEEELKKIILQNNHLNIRAGATGLAGGAVPQKENTLDISKMDKILEFDKDKKTIIVESGTILDDLQDFLIPQNLEFPINPSSHSVCTIGGMIATNAVGSRAIKYGRTSDWILWLDIMNPEGKIERKTKTELMDFAGMEGTTGIIIKACLKLSEKKNRLVKIINLQSITELIEKIKELKKDSKVTMIEYTDKKVSKMIGLDPEYHLFMEEESEQKIKDKKLYETRDQVYPKLAEAGFTRIEDPKLMLEKCPQLLDWLEEREIPTYGHISVGILHPCFSKKQEKLIPEMMKLVKKLGGQISGEHGIGILKKEFIDPNDKKLLINVKKRLDPLNKFNPGKII